MSRYTLIALCIFASVGFVAATTAYWWTSNELNTLKKSIRDHDNYIIETAKVFNQVQIKLAVQESSMKTLEKDITEIMRDVKTLLKR